MDWAPCLLRATAGLAMALDLAACSVPEARTPAQQVADTALAARVETALRTDRYVDADHVTVEANRGVVTLRGQVSDEWDRRGVLRISAAVPGVQRVVDQLEMIYYGSHRGE
jgi:osmotically-inducible protein OsmY